MNLNIKIKLFSVIAITLMSLSVFSIEFPPANVNVVSAEVTDLSPVIWVSGTVVSRNDSKIAADISGRLISLSAIGARVERGEVIARIDDKQLQIQHREELANVLNSKAIFRFLDAEVTRKKRLVKQKLSPVSELDKTVSERDVAKGDVIAAQARLDKTAQNLIYTQLKAPFSGIITQRIANLGEYVDNGSAIVRLVETAHREATIFAPIVAYQFLKNTKKLSITSPLGTGDATIKALVPVANERSHLMEVRLDMSTFDWPIGLSLKAKVANGSSKLSLTVPRDALVLRRDGASVFRINKSEKGAKAERIAVVIGAGMRDLIAVNSTSIDNKIVEGDLIVIRGAERLQDGQNVVIKENNHDLMLSGEKVDTQEKQVKKLFSKDQP